MDIAMEDVAVLPARHRPNVAVYHRMIEAGIFGRDDRIELIDGDLIDMAPISEAHEAIVARLTEALVVAGAGHTIAWPQNSIRIGHWNQPQPDLAVLSRRADFYATGERPGPADVLLLVELADSSLHFDRTVKLPLYARAGIGEYWIVDLQRRALDAYRTPDGDGYGQMTSHQAGEQLALALAPEIVVRLDLFFG